MRASSVVARRLWRCLFSNCVRHNQPISLGLRRSTAHTCRRKQTESLRKLYQRAMQLEADFFAAQPHSPLPRRISLLVVDFDDTISDGDTVGNLMSASAEKAMQSSRSEAERQTLAKELLAKRDWLAANYVVEQRALLAELLPEQAAVAPPGAFNRSLLLSLLDRLSDFDTMMNKVVVKSGILAGLSEADLETAAHKVALRPGSIEALAAAQAAGIPIVVVSANWSAEYVAAALSPLLTDVHRGSDEYGPAPDHSTGKVVIVANRLATGADGLTTGDIVPIVQCARDKAGAFAQLLHGSSRGQPPALAAPEALAALDVAVAGSSQLGSKDTGSAQREVVKAQTCDAAVVARSASVYVGDSASDLLPLINADYGIVIGDNQLLRRIARHCGLQLLPLCTAPLDSATAPGSVLYEARSWLEIHAFLLPLSSELGVLPQQQLQQLPPTAMPAAALPDTIPPAQELLNGTLSNLATSPPRSATLVEEVPRSKALAGTCAAGMVANGQKRQKPVPVVLTIAGSDSGGGAGIQADLKTMLACGVFGTSALAALTAQNTHGVQGILDIPPGFLVQQINSVLSDLGADAVKTGMLPSAAAVVAVAHALQRHGVQNLVVDPVMVSTSGHAFGGDEVAAAITDYLVPLAYILTPNMPEASYLLGGRPVGNVEEMAAAAKELHALGNHGKIACKRTRFVLIKGGHLPSLPPASTSGSAGSSTMQHSAGRSLASVDGSTGACSAAGNSFKDTVMWSGSSVNLAGSNDLVDVLYDGERLHFLRGPRVPTGNTHGTGCTLASAIASELAKGLAPLQAVMAARRYLLGALMSGAGLHIGKGKQRPFHHGYVLSELGADVPCPREALDLRLYAVTDSGCNHRSGRSLVQAIREAVHGGATVVQLREKNIDGCEFVAAARQALQVCRAAGVPLLINDRIDVALAVGADGVHLGQSDIPAAEARRLIGPNRLLGVSVKTPEQTLQARLDGADYVGAGAVFPTGTKDASVIGVEGVAAVVAASAGSMPVCAIGGITGANAVEVLTRSGCDGIAVVSALFAATDLAAATASLRAAVDEELTKRPTR